MTVGVAEFTDIALFCNVLLQGRCAVHHGLFGGPSPSEDKSRAEVGIVNRKVANIPGKHSPCTSDFWHLRHSPLYHAEHVNFLQFQPWMLRQTACHRGWSPLPSLLPKLPSLVPNPQPRVQLESPFLWPLLSMCSSSEPNTPTRKSGTQSQLLSRAAHASQQAFPGSFCGSFAFMSA